jgi:hypothetical protein
MLMQRNGQNSKGKDDKIFFPARGEKNYKMVEQKNKKCKAVEQKNARWSSKKMQGGRAKKCKVAEQKNVRLRSRS